MQKKNCVFLEIIVSNLQRTLLRNCYGIPLRFCNDNFVFEARVTILPNVPLEISIALPYLPLQIYNCHYLSINPQWWSKVNWGITFKNLYIWWQIYYLLTFLMTQQIVNSTPLRMSTNIQTHTQQEAIQSNSNQLFADSPCFTVNKYEHVHRRLAKLLRCTEKWGLQNDRYTQLKTLPLRNFVGGW